MAEQWIEAREAARLFPSTRALRERLAAGAVRCRPEQIVVDNEPVEKGILPDTFWSAEGREPLQEDWAPEILFPALTV